MSVPLEVRGTGRGIRPSLLIAAALAVLLLAINPRTILGIFDVLRSRMTVPPS